MRGYIAIGTVLILAVVGLAIATTVSLLSLGDIDTSYSLSKGEQTYLFVDSCMEDALEKAATTPTYAGGTITRPDGTCSITASKTGNSWTLTATTTATDFVRSIRAIATQSSSLKLYSWKEI